MFEDVSLDHIYNGAGRTHIDFRVRWLRGIKLHTNVRVKLFRSGAGIGLEFRSNPKWPKLFHSWPGSRSDKFGPLFEVSTADRTGLAIAAVDREGAVLLADIAAHLPAAIATLTQNRKISGEDGLRLVDDARQLRTYMADQLKARWRIDIPLATAGDVSQAALQAWLAAGPAEPAAAPDTQEASTVAATACAVPDYVHAVMAELDRVELVQVQASARPLPDAWSPIIISVIKDEIDRLPDFLRHYREAGTERFVFVDNGSTDGSVAFLRTQPDVDLYARHGAFNWTLKQGWINKIVRLYGQDRWYGYFDADEHVVFDGIGARTLRDLTRLMQGRGITRVRGFLIDMYAETPLLGSRYAAHDRLDAAYPYFDADSYTEEAYTETMSVKGGPRTRAFGHVDPKFRPEMTKYPIFRLTADACVANPHYIWPYRENFRSPRHLGVLHYKFLPNIAERIRRAVREENYWGGSLEYKCYATVLARQTSLSLMYPGSRRYAGPADLLAHKLIAPLDWPDTPSAFEMIRAAYLRRRAALERA
jgi:glycosyltransferase involved in cell wall biosynthesis